MPEESNTNTIPPAIDTATSPVETPPTIETTPAPAPAPEPIAPVEPTPAPVVDPAPTPEPVASPAPIAPTAETGNTIQRLLAKAKEKIQFRKRAKLEKIMVFAKAQGGITNDQAQKLLRVSDATATRYLVQLTKNGRLRLVGKSKAARYMPVQ